VQFPESFLAMLANEGCCEAVDRSGMRPILAHLIGRSANLPSPQTRRDRAGHESRWVADEPDFAS
jgi:hypothetical protein